MERIFFLLQNPASAVILRLLNGFQRDVSEYRKTPLSGRTDKTPLRRFFDEKAEKIDLKIGFIIPLIGLE